MTTPIETVIEQVRKLAELQTAYQSSDPMDYHEPYKAEVEFEVACKKHNYAATLSTLTAMARENERLEDELAEVKATHAGERLTPPTPSESEWVQCPAKCHDGLLTLTGGSIGMCRICRTGQGERPGWVQVKPAPSEGKECTCRWKQIAEDREHPVRVRKADCPIHGTAAAGKEGV